MSKFKAGDKVRAVRDTNSDHDAHPAGTVLTVGTPDAPEVLKPHEFTAGPPSHTQRYILPDADFELVPTGLDPTAVRAGGTVTLERNGGRLPDQEVRAISTGAAGRLALVLAGGLMVEVEGPDAWTLTDHQPAPEPEPEWLAGDVAVIETEGAYPGGPRRAVRRGGVWHSLDMEGYAIDDNVTDVRPLVVIDPAAVDVDYLADRLAWGHLGIGLKQVSDVERESLRASVRNTLNGIGIEAP